MEVDFFDLANHQFFPSKPCQGLCYNSSKGHREMRSLYLEGVVTFRINFSLSILCRRKTVRHLNIVR